MISTASVRRTKENTNLLVPVRGPFFGAVNKNFHHIHTGHLRERKAGVSAGERDRGTKADHSLNDNIYHAVIRHSDGKLHQFAKRVVSLSLNGETRRVNVLPANERAFTSVHEQRGSLKGDPPILFVDILKRRKSRRISFFLIRWDVIMGC